MKTVLIRVGIDSGCGGIQGPLFQDGTFEYIPTLMIAELMVAPTGLPREDIASGL